MLESCFSFLLNVCNQITIEYDNDQSIVSENVNLFIEYFKICIKKLEQSGFTLKNIDFSFVF